MSHAGNRSPPRRWAKRLGLGLAGLIALVLLLGSTYEAISRRRAWHEYPVPGKLVDIGGRRLQIDCRGSGSPTVVFEDGLDIDGSVSWAAVHDPIARLTRACAYSRSGIMWSDPRTGPQNARTIALDLHALLRKAGERPPFVLVGHSLGGPYAMVYTRLYPSEVAGLVFVDASHPDQIRRFNAVLPDDAGSEARERREMRIMTALSWTGVVRLAVARMAQPAAGENVSAVDRAVTKEALAYSATSYGAMLKESTALAQSLSDAGRLRTLGARPTVVLTATAPYSDAFLRAVGITRAQADALQAVRLSLQDDEASWSSRSRHELVDDAHHYIQIDRPDVVVAAVRWVIGCLRADSATSIRACPE